MSLQFNEEYAAENINKLPLISQAIEIYGGDRYCKAVDLFLY